MSFLTSRFSFIFCTFGVPNPKTTNITPLISYLNTTIYQDAAGLPIISNSPDRRGLRTLVLVDGCHRRCGDGVPEL